MKIERTKNAGRNIAFGMINKIYTLLVPFIMRTLMIKIMGAEYLGLNSLFTSILQVLNLAELGVGSAMVYSMYKPIAEDDTAKICALMKLYRRYYRIIGGIIAVMGMALFYFVPYLIEETSLANLNNLGLNVYILYALNLGATVLTYWLFAYKNCLLNAHQRNDVVSIISTIVMTIEYGLQIAAIFLQNYYLYLIVALATKIVNNVFTAVVANKMFPNYKPIGQLAKEDRDSINRKIKDLFTSKLGMVVTASVDSIVISKFLGLTILAEYQNYYFILTAVIGILTVVYSSCTAGVGNSLVVESKEKNYNDFKKFTFIIMWIVGWCTTCFLCLFQPFMKIWVGEEYLLSDLMVVFFCIYFNTYEIVTLMSLYKDAAGQWHEDRWRPLTAAMANLAMNITFVILLEPVGGGLYGVIASTFISQIFISIPWLMHNVFHTIFQKEWVKDYLINILLYVGLSAVAATLTYFICWLIPISNVWIQLIVNFAFCLVVPNALFLLVLHRKKEFKESCELINRIFKGKILILERK